MFSIWEKNWKNRWFLNRKICLLVIFSLVFLTGCGHGKPAVESNLANSAASCPPKASDYPPWVLNPCLNGRLGAVGMAKKQSGNARSQQWVAEKVARANLAKQFNILVKAICESKRRAQFSDGLLVKYDSSINCTALQKTDHRFSIYNLGPRVKDRWVDPENGDMYVWIVVTEDF